jgi:hypothetical protein
MIGNVSIMGGNKSGIATAQTQRFAILTMN